LNDNRSSGDRQENRSSMTNAPTVSDRSSVNDTNRQVVLDEISTTWSRLSKPELSALVSNDDGVTQVFARHGVERHSAMSMP
jgi:hypothetical protein